MSPLIATRVGPNGRPGADGGGRNPNIHGGVCGSPRSEQASWHNGELVLSCPDAIAKALAKHLDTREGIVRPAHGAPSAEQKDVSHCPECEGVVAYESGCRVCHSCGWSKCG